MPRPTFIQSASLPASAAPDVSLRPGDDVNAAGRAQASPVNATSAYGTTSTAAPGAVPAQSEFASGRCRVFVSYAHRDETQTTTLQRGCGLPSAFWKQLQLLARSLQRRGIDLSPAQVFFDQERLKTVDRWTVAIEQALQECEVFIFLVSANSLDSPFCMERELQQAVLRGVPVVPVLLTRVHGWGDQGPSGIPSFRLGHCHSGGLPKGPDANALPVSHWSHEDDAWARVCADLDTLLSERLATTGSPASPPNFHEQAGAPWMMEET
jgi:hypothetical protein